MKYQNAQNIIKNPNAAGQKEAKDLVKKISRLMLLPENEEPTVATVSDYRKLKDQPFFRNAQNGDKVLIYTKAAIAILYSPKLDKILAVVPVNLGETQTPLRIALYNGTVITGLTNTVEQQLKTKLNNIVISEKANAKSIYQKTLVIDLTGSHGKAVAELATLLDGEAASLPKGETVPSHSDLLVILGK